MSDKDSNNLGSLQEKIIDILWSSDQPLKPAQVVAKLGGHHAYTTINTILKRMLDKKILMRDLRGKVYYYYPCHCREDFVETKLKSTFTDLINTHGRVAIGNFVDVVKHNKEDLAFLKKYLTD